MTRYIDADALEKDLDTIWFSDKGTCHDVYACLRDAPTIDAVEVVRCKDCIHGWFGEMLKGADGLDRMCKWYGIGVDNNHYCSHGERKRGGTE